MDREEKLQRERMVKILSNIDNGLREMNRSLRRTTTALEKLAAAAHPTTPTEETNAQG